MQVKEALKQRKATRAFLPQEVEKAKIVRILMRRVTPHPEPTPSRGR